MIVEESDPLKQGLKRSYLGNYSSTITNVEESDPLKQGLKPGLLIAFLLLIAVEESDPLKQGLKHNITYTP